MISYYFVTIFRIQKHTVINNGILTKQKLYFINVRLHLIDFSLYSLDNVWLYPVLFGIIGFAMSITISARNNYAPKKVDRLSTTHIWHYLTDPPVRYSSSTRKIKICTQFTRVINCYLQLFKQARLCCFRKISWPQQ
jgi:hypothetical protein